MKSDESAKVFGEGYNCAQGVLVPFAAERGLGAEAAFRISSAFGAGMARSQETCGAVTGALMAIGLKYGSPEAGNQAARDRVLQKSKELIARFKEEFGTTRCGDLLNLDLNTEEGQRLHKESGQRDKVCMKCVKFAASVVEGL